MYEAMGDYLQALYDDDDEQARVIGPRVGVAYRKIRAALSSNDGSRTL